MYTYILKLRSGVECLVNNIMSLDSNETAVTIGPNDGLEANKKYQYTVTAVNDIGSTMSDT